MPQKKTAPHPIHAPEQAHALFYTGPMQAEQRAVPLPPLAPGQALVRMRLSALSRGTERLIALGLVPPAEYTRMRCPLQEGDFPFPVKYGYCAIGEVEQGPPEWLGRRVFVLHPHQDRFVCATSWLNLVPDDLPDHRAVLAANMETALNAVWDSGVSAADRVTVVGGGLVGLLITYLCAQMPGTQVTLIDINPARAELARQLGATFALPANAPQGGDIAFHTSATAPGLATALGTLGQEGRLVEVSWYGDKPVTLPLGGHFHAGRLHILSSQVGTISPGHAARGWSYSSRLQAALGLMRDERLDALLSERIAFSDLAPAIPRLLAAEASGIVTLIDYP